MWSAMRARCRWSRVSRSLINYLDALNGWQLVAEASHADMFRLLVWRLPVRSM